MSVAEDIPLFTDPYSILCPSFCRLECFRLFDLKTGHEPVELLPGQLFYFQLVSGPAEPALDFHTFKDHSGVRYSKVVIKRRKAE